MTPTNHVRFIVACVTFLATVSALCGAWLLWKGFAGGGELVMVVGSAIGGLLGFLSNRSQTPSVGDPPAPVTVTNQPNQPVPTTETKTPLQ